MEFESHPKPSAEQIQWKLGDIVLNPGQVMDSSTLVVMIDR